MRALLLLPEQLEKADAALTAGGKNKQERRRFIHGAPRNPFGEERARLNPVFLESG